MDIFFFVTTVAVVLFSTVFLIALIFIVRILQDIREITKIARRETAELAEDFDAVRADIKEGVADAREAVSVGLRTAQAASGVAGAAGIMRALVGIFDSFGETKRRTRRRHKRSGE